MADSTITDKRFVLQDIRLVWDKIQPKVAKLQQERNFPWRPEDVYAQCLSGQSFCFTLDEVFIICNPQENQYTLAKELFIWIWYSESTEDFADYRYAINEVAKDIYATSIIFISPREGFKRLAKRHDWPSLTTYTLPVDNICPYLP
jgi:hypothetical protein